MILWLLFPALFLHAHLCAEFDALTWDQAVENTLAASPSLSIAADGIGIKDGERRQSRLLPNPVFGYSAENVFGNKNWHDWDAAESRYELAQLIELGGKRGYRFNAAQYLLYASEMAYEAEKTRVLNQLYKAFLEAAAAQERLGLAREQTRIAAEVHKTVAAKVEAGKVSLIQRNKAEIALSTALIEQEQADVNLKTALERLALFWGQSCIEDMQVEFPFYTRDPLSCLDDCLHEIDIHPELLRAQFELLSATQVWHLEKAGSIPDLTVSIGYKTLQDTGNKGMIVGASLPIPILNRNQGNIQRAHFEIERSQDLLEQLRLRLVNNLSLAYKEIQQAEREADRFEATVLKTATLSFEFAQEGYREGKFEYLDMLDSQKTLFEVRERYIQTLLKYHQSKADILFIRS